ncbi:MAG: MFS transporter [Bacillota bacterium]|nr:MFS transporter [Bacillota bacterium]
MRTAQSQRSILSRMMLLSIGDVLPGVSLVIISMLFLCFLVQDVSNNTSVGLPPVLAGVVALIGGLAGIILAPVFGHLSDQSRSGYGRRRAFFLFGIVPVAASFALIWLTFKTDSIAFKAVFYTLAYALFNLVFAMVFTPYEALPADMTEDFKKRSSFFSIRTLVFSLAALGCLLSAMPIVKVFPNKPQAAFLVLGAFFGALSSVPWFFAFFKARERHVDATDYGRHTRLFSAIRAALQNRSLRAALFMEACAFFTALALFLLLTPYIAFYLNKAGDITLILAFAAGGAIISSLISAVLTTKKGAGYAYRTGLLVTAAGLITTFFLPLDTPAILFAIAAALSGAGIALAVAAGRVALSFASDVGEFMFQRPMRGLYAGLSLSIKILLLSLALFISGLIFKYFGLGLTEPLLDAMTGTPLAILRIAFLLLPMLGLIAGIAVSFMCPFTQKSYIIIRNENMKKRSGAEIDVEDKESIYTAERLTGKPYGDLME